MPTDNEPNQPTKPQIPSIDFLRDMVRHVGRIVRDLDEGGMIEGSTEGDDGLYGFGVSEGVALLERLWNPRKIPYGGNGRKAFIASGWPDGYRLMRPMRRIHDAIDELIELWQLQHVCEGKPYMRSGTGPLYPPVPQSLVETLSKEATWIVEYVTEVCEPVVAEQDGPGLRIANDPDGGEQPANTAKPPQDAETPWNMVPLLETTNRDLWVTQVEFARTLIPDESDTAAAKAKVKALKTARNRGRKATGCHVGLCANGYIWRADPEKSGTMWYYIGPDTEDIATQINR